MDGSFRRNSTSLDGGFVSLETAPATAIISTVDAKAHCRVEHSEDDDLIDGLVSSVSSHLDAEHGILGRSLISQSWRLTLNDVPCGEILRLPFPPVQSVTSVKYFDTEGVEQTLSGSNYRLIKGDDEPFIELVSGASWPSVQDRSGAFWVIYVAGYGDAASDLPPDLVTGAKMLLGHFYENREAAQEGVVSSVPLAFEAITDKYKLGRF